MRENSPYQENIITETYQKLDNSYVKEPPELGDLLVTPPQPKQVLPSITERQKPEIMRQPQVISQTEHVPSAQNTHRQPLSLKIVTRQFPSYPDLYLKPPPRPINLKENRRNLTDLA